MEEIVFSFDDSDLLMYDYLCQLQRAKNNVAKIFALNDQHQNFDTITHDKLQDNFYVLDDCQTSFYNYTTLCKMFIQFRTFTNPLTRQFIQKITKATFIKTNVA